MSTFKTRTSTRSPGPRARLRRRWLTGSLSRVMLLLWMRPDRPTPISTKAPNSAVLSTRPVSTAPTRRSLIDTMPRLKSACPKSGDGKERDWEREYQTVRWLNDSEEECLGGEREMGMRENEGGGAEMTNRYYISSCNQILGSTYFHISQHFTRSHFPLGLFMRDLFPFCSINTNKEGSRPRK